MAFLQASNTKNDVVVALWTCLLSYWVMQLRSASPLRWRQAALLGLGFGALLLTKGTGMIFGLPVAGADARSARSAPPSASHSCAPAHDDGRPRDERRRLRAELRGLRHASPERSGHSRRRHRRQPGDLRPRPRLQRGAQRRATSDDSQRVAQRPAHAARRSPAREARAGRRRSQDHVPGGALPPLHLHAGRRGHGGGPGPHAPAVAAAGGPAVEPPSRGGAKPP